MKRNGRIIAAIRKNRERILALLRGLVECNSYVHNKAGVERVAEMILREMPRGFEHERIPSAQFADHHRLSHVRGASSPVVLAGHLDTLCPPESPFRHMAEQGEKILGPGTCDMKGGLVVLIWALKTLELCGLLDDLSVVCLFNTDEEVGSPTSAPLFTALRDKASHALVFEAGGPEGTVVTTRKGVARYRLDIEGKAAHFGCLKGAKCSAIEDLAHKVLAIESLNAPDGSLVANVGKVEGGLAANAVAERANMDFETRYWTADVEARAADAVRKIVSHPAVPGCRLNLNRLSHRPPLQPSPESRALFERICAVAKTLGQNIVEEKRGGVSDANWLAHAGIPTIDGLGPIGDGDFTDQEYILKESLFQRIELTAHVLLSLAGKE